MVIIHQNTSYFYKARVHTYDDEKEKVNIDTLFFSFFLGRKKNPKEYCTTFQSLHFIFFQTFFSMQTMPSVLHRRHSMTLLSLYDLETLTIFSDSVYTELMTSQVNLQVKINYITAFLVIF